MLEGVGCVGKLWGLERDIYKETYERGEDSNLRRCRIVSGVRSAGGGSGGVRDKLRNGGWDLVEVCEKLVSSNILPRPRSTRLHGLVVLISVASVGYITRHASIPAIFCAAITDFIRTPPFLYPASRVTSIAIQRSFINPSHTYLQSSTEKNHTKKAKQKIP